MTLAMIAAERLPVRTEDGDLIGHYIVRKCNARFVRVTVVKGGPGTIGMGYNWDIKLYASEYGPERSLHVPESEIPVIRKTVGFEPLMKMAMN